MNNITITILIASIATIITVGLTAITVFFMIMKFVREPLDKRDSELRKDIAGVRNDMQSGVKSVNDRIDKLYELLFSISQANHARLECYD